MISLSTGNSKLSKENGKSYKILSFGTPADVNFNINGVMHNTCRGASACKGVCYAKQGRYLMQNVRDARYRNLEASLKDTFVEDMNKALAAKRSYNTVRIHDSGDFYSQEYYDKWCKIAESNPDRLFYAYTKALDLDLFSNKPDNFRIIQSLGGLFDRQIDMTKSHSRIFANDDARLSAGYVDGNINDLPAIEGVVRIGLVYHGQRKLTLPQIKYFG